jgi:hypothetical protein
MIDDVLSAGCKDFDSFLASMKAKNVEVKRGKHLAFKIPGGKRFVRCDSLSEDYSETAILERISGLRKVSHRTKEETAVMPSKPNMLIDIQAKLQQAHSPGFERWAKIYNLKEMAKTLVYLQEKGLTDFSELEKSCEEASRKFNTLTERSRAISARKKEISELQRNIGTYSKTREVYAQYRKLSGKKQTKFYDEHTGDIISCQAAKRYFNSLGLKKLPSIQSLKQEYAALDAEDRKIYPQLKQARAEMIELLTAKNNTERILGMDTKQQKRQKEAER